MMMNVRVHSILYVTISSFIKIITLKMSDNFNTFKIMVIALWDDEKQVTYIWDMI